MKIFKIEFAEALVHLSISKHHRKLNSISSETSNKKARSGKRKCKNYKKKRLQKNKRLGKCLLMIEIREMPYNEKFEKILSLNKLVEDFAPHLVKRELGEEEVKELQNLWTKEREPIPRDAPDNIKYEIAYRNFMKNWVTANNYFVKHKGEAGVTKFMQAAIKAWKRKYARVAFTLKIVWFFSPRFAFKALAERLAYQLQIFSPYVVSELDDNHMILKVTPCKIADTSSDFCIAACQNIIPEWLEAQFNVNMSQNRLGNECTVKFSPF